MTIPGKRLRLGEILINAGVLTEDQLAQGLSKQQQTREPLGEILIALGHVTDAQIKHALELQYGVKSFSMKQKPPQELVRLLPEAMIRQHQILPVGISQMTVAMVDPNNILALDDLRLRFKGVSLQPVVITDADFREILKVIPRETVVAAAPEAEARPEEERPDASLAGEDQTAAQYAQGLLATALKRKATEIVLEPQEHETWVRLRIDGSLVREPSIAPRLGAAVIGRFKVLANLAPTSGGMAQTGTVKTRHEGRSIHLTLRALTVKHGQMLTLRLFDQSALEQTSLDSIVHHPGTREVLRRLLRLKSGLLLINGPKHSGKDTLLYALLKEALKDNRSVIGFGTMPFELEGIAQAPLDTHRPDLSLSQVFEQSPDLLAVPSLTEPELARGLVHGALAGAAAIVGIPTAQRFLHQLLDLSELAPRPVANAVAGVVVIRLVRKLCPACKVPYKPDDQTFAFFKAINETGMLYRSVGCPECHETGYAGQVGIFGVLPFDAQLRHLVASNTPQPQIDQYAKQRGHMALYDYATWVAAQGLTTLDELAKTDLFERVSEASHG
ncbi:Type II secretion system protein E [compost metagenome]